MSNSSRYIKEENKILPSYIKVTSSISDRSIKSQNENIDAEKAYKNRLNRILLLKQQKENNNNNSNSMNFN